MSFNIETVGGYSSMFPASYLELLSAMEAHENPGAKLGQGHQNYIAPKAVTSTLLPMLNVKYLVIPSNADLRDDLKPYYSLRHRSDLAVFQATRYLPRAYIVHQYRQARSRAETINLMLRNDFDPARLAIGEQSLPDLAKASSESLPAGSQVTISRPTTDRFELDVQMAGPGILVVSEQFFPGWEARVDGLDTEIFPVNAVLMGLALAGGRHHVTIRFFPKPLKQGLWVTGLTVGGVLILLVADSRRGRGTRDPDS
jgi:hypothetical protein